MEVAAQEEEVSGESFTLYLPLIQKVAALAAAQMQSAQNLPWGIYLPLVLNQNQ
jgi:hypothetical protein